MKNLKRFLLAVILLGAIPGATFASTSDIIKEENGQKCMDLEAIYAEINNESKALTGQDSSIDAVKKAQIVATLTNITSILIGQQLFCVNDEVSAEKVGSLDSIGILGQINHANNQMFAYFPTVNVGDHLAQEFLPGYGTENSLLAQEETSDQGGIFQKAIENAVDNMEQDATNRVNDTLNNGEGSGITDSVQDKLEESLDSAVGEQLDSAEEMLEEIENDQQQVGEVTLSGYDYLRNSLHLDSVWKVFRNIAYVFFIIIMIITGFMIMFRKNLPGQVVASLGNTLPQLILGIILVTFSFSIAGIVMDAGKFSMNIIDNIFVQAYSDIEGDVELDDSPEVIVEDTVTVGDVGELTNQAIKDSKKDSKVLNWIREKMPFGMGDSIANFVGKMGGSFAALGLQSFTLLGVNKLAGVVKELEINWTSSVPALDIVLSILSTIVEFTLDASVTILQMGVIAFLVRNLLILLVTLYASFKLFITMITTYLKLFINIIFAPIQIAIGSLPGNSSMIGKWFKSLISNVLVFVGIHVVILLFSYISKVIDPEQFNFFGNSGVVWPNWLISLQGIILIGGYLFASSMPTIINGMLKVETSKEMASVGQSVKQAASKIPLVGGMFGA